MKKILLPILIGMLAAGLAAGEGFEGPEYQAGHALTEKSGWDITPGEGDARSTPAITGEQSSEGSQSLQVPAASSLRKALTPLGSQAVRFVDFDILPVFGEDVTFSIGGAVLVFSKEAETGEIGPRSETRESSVRSPQYPLQPGSSLGEAWVRVTIRLAGNKWDLFLDGEPIKANLLVEESTGFLEIQGAVNGDIYLDRYSDGTENPLFADADKDGMPDREEKGYGLNAYADDRDGDLDGDGISNVNELFAGTSPQAPGIGGQQTSRFIYVDNRHGSDVNSGARSYPAAGNNGPKASLKAAMAAAPAGSTIIVLKGLGIYKEGSRSGEGKSLTIKPVDPVTIR